MSSFWSVFEGPFLVFLLLLILPVVTRPEEATAAQLTLSWTDNSGNEDGFKIERETGQAGTFAQINTVGANVLSYTDSGLAEGTEYCYRVRAFNGAGDSAYTNEDCGIAATTDGGGGSAGGASSGGCFIATAAFGSPLAAEVQILR
ncbi:MAG: fibronectin type III domain-containing protein, partial [Acidobacteria bacterium]|nr:fibronectin type III domain-containing protein [Acidobacteriota bacterium]